MGSNIGNNFEECRTRVHDDAFEAKLTLHMVTPLLTGGGDLSDFGKVNLRQSGLFLRRSLTRYLALVLCRMLDRPNDKGRTGVTASVESLLEMALAENTLAKVQVEKLVEDFENIKSTARTGEYDLIEALRSLRNIQVAHSLIPHVDPTDQLWAHDLLEFANEMFQFVVDAEKIISEATGTSLSSLPENAESFRLNSNQFWEKLGVITSRA